MCEHCEERDEHDYEPPEESRFVMLCHECQRETAGESCGLCGRALCPSCFEGGGGFCHGPHTQEQVDAYEELVTGKPVPESRKELRKLGILPSLP